MFLLSSDIGGGKTTFTKGLAKGLGCRLVVSSPTFTVSQIYPCRDSLEIHHFDFYRLNDAGVVGYELSESLGDKSVITVVEWGDIVGDIIPHDHITVILNRSIKGENIRNVTITYADKFNYLIEGLE